MTTFCERLQARRRFVGHSQRSLAEAAHIHARTVRRIEAGQNLTEMPTVRRLARALGVLPGWLLFGVGDPFAPRVAWREPCPMCRRRNDGR